MAKKKPADYNVTGRIPLRILRSFTALYVFLMMVVYPIYFEDKYYNMGEAKWNFFKVVTFVGLPVLILIFVWYLIELAGKNELKQKAQAFFKGLYLTDYFVIAFFVASVLSYLFSDFRDEAFWGFEGWYMGLLAQMCFVVIYFFVSRFWRWDPPMILCYFAAAAFVFYMGVIMRFNIDPMLMYEDLEEGYKLQFLSTLGQATWYSSYLIMLLPLGMFAFWYYDKLWVRIVTGIFSAIGFMSLVTQNSDSAYLGLAAMFIMLFWISFKNMKSLYRFFECLMLALASFKFMGICQVAFPEITVRLDDLSFGISQGNITWILLAVVAIIYAVLRVVDKKKEVDVSKISWLRYMVVGMSVLALIAISVYIYMNTNGMLSEGMASDNNYLYFNYEWGNGRGGSWIFAIETFEISDIVDKIFGAGPDCFCYQVYTFFYEELNAYWGEDRTLACAHNEWLNMLLCEGIVGFVAYVGIFVSAVRMCITKAAKSQEMAGIAIAIVAYMAHNAFCYQQIICTPIIFILIGIAVALNDHGYDREIGLL